MPEGIIITKIPEIPENCFYCSLSSDVDYCPYVKEYVEYWAFKGMRHPECPIKPMPGKKSIKNNTSMTGTYIQKYAEGYNDCVDEILGGK